MAQRDATFAWFDAINDQEVYFQDQKIPLFQCE